MAAVSNRQAQNQKSEAEDASHSPWVIDLLSAIHIEAVYHNLMKSELGLRQQAAAFPDDSLQSPAAAGCRSPWLRALPWREWASVFRMRLK